MFHAFICTALQSYNVICNILAIRHTSTVLLNNPIVTLLVLDMDVFDLSVVLLTRMFLTHVLEHQAAMMLRCNKVSVLAVLVKFSRALYALLYVSLGVFLLVLALVLVLSGGVRCTRL